ncbi:hypothetical protein LSAT2_023927 [Lamellibrachia satsuma]|nr:hypothetical protein LSAT2_023927 [Lamellibrachia satsuma]
MAQMANRLLSAFTTQNPLNQTPSVDEAGHRLLRYATHRATGEQRRQFRLLSETITTSPRIPRQLWLMTMRVSWRKRSQQERRKPSSDHWPQNPSTCG